MTLSETDSPLQYEPEIEQALMELEPLLLGSYAVSRRTLALQILQGDEEVLQLMEEQEGRGARVRAEAIRERLQEQMPEPIDWYISRKRRQWGQELAQSAVVEQVAPASKTFAQWVSALCMSPVTGFPILALVLYFGLFQFVGVFGAGTVVDYVENTLFAEHINPVVTRFFEAVIPWKTLQELFVGEYGIWTLGVTYAVALILPIVTFFFLVFAILEDSGYLPRLAMLIDRAFKKLGLNGRAVIPIVLGFGCDTMATVVTRVLETRRERLLTIFLLSLTIPCSAQLGVVLALLAGHPKGLMIWAGVLVMVFLIAGWLAAKVLPGAPAPFYMEIPPMRLPSLSNVFVKTLARLQWYFMEVFPLFIIASVLIWIGQLTGLFDLAVWALEPVARMLTLPDEAAIAFLFGFFRRDYGAAGLYDLNERDLLTGNQLLIVSVVLTLFIPCVAQVLVTVKERGLKTAVAMILFTLAFALLVGVCLSRVLMMLGINV